MKYVVLIGATGFVGSAILSELLNRGHKVTAVVRNASKLPKHDNPYYDDELAFTQAAEEHAAQMEAVFSGTPGPMNAVTPRRKHK